MYKPPEQGEIWEWRAFGDVSDRITTKLRERPIRMGVLNHQGEDLYLISPATDQNIKLRRWGADRVLKIKLLLTSGARGMELYSETPGMVYTFPVAAEVLAQVARLLATILPIEITVGASVTQDGFIAALTESSPGIVFVPVIKTRSQFDFGAGWVELATVNFPARRTQSLSVHSLDNRCVEEILDELQADDGLQPMNYVQACRRWL